MLILYDIIKEI